MNVVIIPCYKVKKHILDVINSIGSEIDVILVIDDACPEESGTYVELNNIDKRVIVLKHKINKGVGGACKTGYKYALSINAKNVIKIDGDGQMDASLIPQLIQALESECDYVKGNRFYDLGSLSSMPFVRLFGNSVLSLINKFVNGYWNIMDPTNGYTGISGEVLALIPLEKLENRYFFESDMLFRLSTIRAKVNDITMISKYADETSSLSVKQILFTFPPKYIIRYFKRLFYNYFLRDFNVASLELVVGLMLFISGIITGLYFWVKGVQNMEYSTSGQVMLAALPIIIGFQLLLSALNYDIQNYPKKAIRKF